MNNTLVDHNVQPSAVAYTTEGSQMTRSVQYVTSAC